MTGGLTTRAAISLTLGVAGTILFLLGLGHVLDAGTCGTGGPFEIARECPEDTGTWAIVMAVGFPVFMAGLLTSEGGLVEPGAGQIVWTIFFAGGGIAMLVKGFTDAGLDSDAELAVYIVAAVLIPMGLVVGVIGLTQLRRRRR